MRLSFVQLSTSGHALGLSLVDGVNERGRINPGFDGGLVTAQLGLGIGQSAPGLLELSIGKGTTLGVEGTRALTTRLILDTAFGR